MTAGVSLRKIPILLFPGQPSPYSGRPMRKQPPILQTTTDEPYLPTRPVYTVHQPDALHRWFERHPTMTWDTDLRRWTWNYHRKLRKLGFPAAYEEAVRRQGGLVLASCR